MSGRVFPYGRKFRVLDRQPKKARTGDLLIHYKFSASATSRHRPTHSVADPNLLIGNSHHLWHLLTLTAMGRLATSFHGVRLGSADPMRTPRRCAARPCRARDGERRPNLPLPIFAARPEMARAAPVRPSRSPKRAKLLPRSWRGCQGNEPRAGAEGSRKSRTGEAGAEPSHAAGADRRLETVSPCRQAAELCR